MLRVRGSWDKSRHKGEAERLFLVVPSPLLAGEVRGDFALA